MRLPWVKSVLLVCVSTAALAAPARPEPKAARTTAVDGGGAPCAAVASDGTAYVATASHLTAYRPDGTDARRFEAPLFVEDILPLRGGDIAVGGWFIEPLAIGGRTYPANDKQHRFVVARFSPTGQVRWTQDEGEAYLPRDSYGSSTHRVHGFFAEAPDGAVVALFHDAIVRYGRDGRPTWRQRFDPGNLDARGIATDARGDVYFTGTVSRPTQLGDRVLDPGTYPIGDIAAGKLDGATGRWLWARMFGSAGDDRATAIAMLPDGNVLVAGQLAKPAALGCASQPGVASNGFAIALSPSDGACAWWHSYPVAAGLIYPTAYFDALSADARGIVATGFLPATKDRDGVRVLAGLSPSGDVQWTVPIALEVHRMAAGETGIWLAGKPTGDRTILGKRIGGDRSSIAIAEVR